LGPLNKQASMELLKHKLKSLSSAMEPDFVEKVIYLSEGKPILMELTLDWLVHGVPLEWLVESHLKEIKETKEERKKEFEAQLVSSITQMRSPMDQLVLKMAHVYPLTEDMAEEILDKPVGDVSHLFEHAKSYAFVKLLPDDRISLHDEMRYMVQKYVWNEIDPGKTQRKKLSNIAANFYSRRVAALENKIRSLNKSIQTNTKDDSKLLLKRDDLIRLYDTANLQWLEYTLQVQVEKGIDLYKNLEEKAREEHRIRFVQKLTRLVRRRIGEFNSDQRYEINLRYGRLLNDMGRGNAQTAKNLFTEMLNEYEDDPKRAANIYHLLGVSEVALGQFNLALEHEKRSLDLFRQLHDLSSISILENYIGYINRLKGEWNKAIEYYHRAIQSALEMNTFRPAGIYNNLGYVYGLMGRYGVAEDYCNDAIEIWKEENREKGVIRGEVTLANVHRDAGEYQEAINKFQKAINILELPDDYVTLIRAYFGLAWTQWFVGENEKDQDKLLQAKFNFDQALALAREYNFIVELPGILHQASNVYWLLGDKEKARSLNEEAYELSKLINDIRYAVDSLVGFAEFDYKDRKYDNIVSYAEKLKSDYESKGYEFPLFYGRMRRILADVAFDRCEYKDALEWYAKSIAMMSQHGGWGRYNFSRELQNLENRIKSLSDDEVNNWIDRLLDYWSKNASENKVANLVRWCYTVKNSLLNN
jgi:tetratricopeptide (TPR) repeat protein